MDIRWVAFPLHPETPEEGMTLEALFSGRPVDIQAMMNRLKAVADQEGLPLGDRLKTYNSRLAQELGHWAESLGRGRAFHEAAFRAYFADGMNLGKIPVLVKIAASVGLDSEAARGVLETRAFRESVDADWQYSRSEGIRAVPSFKIGKAVLVGAQSYQNLETFLIRNRFPATEGER
jgi:predicted DsbA family dithiol-disulfide isomerase